MRVFVSSAWGTQELELSADATGSALKRALAVRPTHDCSFAQRVAAPEPALVRLLPLTLCASPRARRRSAACRCTRKRSASAVVRCRTAWRWRAWASATTPRCDWLSAPEARSRSRSRARARARARARDAAARAAVTRGRRPALRQFRAALANNLSRCLSRRRHHDQGEDAYRQGD